MYSPTTTLREKIMPGAKSSFENDISMHEIVYAMILSCMKLFLRVVPMDRYGGRSQGACLAGSTQSTRTLPSLSKHLASFIDWLVGCVWLLMAFSCSGSGWHALATHLPSLILPMLRLLSFKVQGLKVV